MIETDRQPGAILLNQPPGALQSVRLGSFNIQFNQVYWLTVQNVVLGNDRYLGRSSLGEFAR